MVHASALPLGALFLTIVLISILRKVHLSSQRKQGYRKKGKEKKPSHDSSCLPFTLGCH